MTPAAFVAAACNFWLDADLLSITVAIDDASNQHFMFLFLCFYRTLQSNLLHRYESGISLFAGRKCKSAFPKVSNFFFKFSTWQVVKSREEWIHFGSEKSLLKSKRSLHHYKYWMSTGLSGE